MLTGKIDEQPAAGEYLRDERLFVKPILRILQDNGGELAKISDLDNFICDYTNLTKEDLASSRISKSGSTWRPYIFKRNFAAINLREAGFIAKLVSPEKRRGKRMEEQECLKITGFLKPNWPDVP